MLKKAFAGRQVLLIDDEEVVREIGVEMLASLGIECICAENGEKGILCYKEAQDMIELVILDVEMPGISGDRVFDILKEINPELKILIISGYAKNYLEAKFFKRKINHFMPKPFHLNALTNNLHALVSGHQNKTGAA